MIRSIYIIVFSLVFFSCISTDKKKRGEAQPLNGKEIVFRLDTMPVSDTINLGKIRKGEIVKHVVRFVNRNSSNKALVLLSHKTSCGCTTIEHDKSPIAPNQYRDVTIVFNSNHTDVGKQLKLLRIYTSFMKSPYRLYVEAQVE